MGNDPELAAMQEVSEALSDLDSEAAARVIRWAADRHDVTVAGSSPQGTAAASKSEMGMEGEFEDFADLFFQASPSTDQEKVLAAGYWFQAVEGDDDLTARQINDELKHLGHQISNITRAFNRLIGKNPALAMQVRKTGSSQQARKIYRLTKAGLRRVEEMLRDEEA